MSSFNDPAKGNCNSCHLSERGDDSTPPQFTDFGLIAIGVPRNADIPANADPTFFDLGACGPLRTDLKGRVDYCGVFRTPSCAMSPRGRPSSTTGCSTACARPCVLRRAGYQARPMVPAQGRRQRADVRRFTAVYHANINVEPPFDRRPGNHPR